jgi:hypothetical protein
MIGFPLRRCILWTREISSIGVRSAIRYFWGSFTFGDCLEGSADLDKEVVLWRHY